MNISNSIRPANTTRVSPLPHKINTKEQTVSLEPEAPQETFTPTNGIKRIAGDVAPYALTGLGLAAGLVTALSSGGVAMATGALALGTVGTAAGVLAGGLSGMGAPDTHVHPIAGGVLFGAIGASLGAGAAALPGVVGSVVGGLLVGGVAGAAGNYVGGILQSDGRGEF